MNGPQDPRLAWIPDDLVKRIRNTTAVTGFGTVVLSVVLAALIVVLAYDLPTSDNPLTGFVVVTGGASSFFLLVSGLVLTSGRNCVSTGRLDVSAASRTWRATLVFWLGTILSQALSCWFLVKAVESSGGYSQQPQVSFGPPIFAYLLLLVTPVALAGVDFLVAHFLLRRAPKSLAGRGQAADR